MKNRSIKKLPNHIISRKLLSKILDDFSMFGSTPFYLFVTIAAFYLGNTTLAFRLVYGGLIGIIVILIIKTVHYKDRPQKEEFTLFIDKLMASSFPSSHSMVVTGIAILLSISYPDILIILLLSFISLIVFIQRYIRKKHFVIDIIGGMIISIVIAIFVVKVF